MSGFWWSLALAAAGAAYYAVKSSRDYKAATKPDSFGCTALFGAAEKGDLAEVKRLIGIGASLTRTDYLSPTMLACMNGHTEVAKYLLHLPPDPLFIAGPMSPSCPANNRYWDGSTYLMAASARGHMDVVEMLLAIGADPNFETYDEGVYHSSGLTALDLAIHNDHEDIARFLRSHGAVRGRSTTDDSG